MTTIAASWRHADTLLQTTNTQLERLAKRIGDSENPPDNSVQFTPQQVKQACEEWLSVYGDWPICHSIVVDKNFELDEIGKCINVVSQEFGKFPSTASVMQYADLLGFLSALLVLEYQEVIDSDDEDDE